MSASGFVRASSLRVSARRLVFPILQNVTYKLHSPEPRSKLKTSRLRPSARIFNSLSIEPVSKAPLQWSLGWTLHRTLHWTLRYTLGWTLQGTLHPTLQCTLHWTLHPTLYWTLQGTLHWALYRTLYPTLQWALHPTLGWTLHWTLQWSLGSRSALIIQRSSFRVALHRALGTRSVQRSFRDNFILRFGRALAVLRTK